MTTPLQNPAYSDFGKNCDIPPPPYSAGFQPQTGYAQPQNSGTPGQQLPYPAQPVETGFAPPQYFHATSQQNYPGYVTGPNQNVYPPQQQGSYNPPQQGSYIPPQQGSYIPPQQGSYIPPQQGHFIPSPQQTDYPNATGLDPDNRSSSNENIVEDWRGFSDKAIRNAFIRKVYAILMLQLAFTVGIIALFIFHKGVKQYVQKSIGMYIAAYIFFLAIYIALVCCKDLRRKYPTNLVLLSLFTVCLTYLVAVISSFHDTNIVIMALGICTACCLVISIFSCFTKFDITSCAGVLFILVWVLFFFGILCIFTRNDIMNTVYAGLGALLFMMFLAFDTQMVMGGKKYQLSPEEHIFAALQLYLDIIYIFLFILTLLGGSKK